MVLAALVAIGVYAQHRYAFQWHSLRPARAGRLAQDRLCRRLHLRGLRLPLGALGLLLRHNKKVPLFSLLGTQVIGFTAVALIGRVADPVRPYLVAKKTGLPFSSQIAVYIVERLFDFGSMALIFSLALFWIPQPALAASPGHAGFFSHLFAPLVHRFPILAIVLPASARC